MHHSPIDARKIYRAVSVFAKPDPAKSLAELVTTLTLFALTWAVTLAAVSRSFWPGLIFAVLAGGLLLRLFVIQHDCGHGSLFHRRALNDWVGRALSVLTLTPYDSWRRSHAKHHATSGNLGKRGSGDFDTLTVAEYQAKSPARRRLYRLYRNPFVFLLLGPAFTFFVRHRMPLGQLGGGWRTWASTVATNAVIGIVAALAIWQIGLVNFLAVHVPIVLVAATAGVWLFYVQHQFEDTAWEADKDWGFHEAALHGSSHYDLPPALRWLTGNIGLHHVHHLSSRIPFYRLPEVMRAHPELAKVGRVTFGQSIATVGLKLWDPDTRRLRSFRD